MMAKKEYHESESLELKSSLTDSKGIIETLSAFSNTDGGQILIGINDSGSVKGVDIGSNTLENLANDIKRNTDPPLFPSITIKKMEKKNVVSIVVKESPIKPVFAFDRAFKRVGKTNQRLTSADIRELSRVGVDYCFTAQKAKGATFDDISEESIERFLNQSKERRGWTVKHTGKRDFLAKMGLLDGNNLNIAALLLFGSQPQQFVIQSEVRCGRFKGIVPLEFEDFDVIGGDLFAQVDGLMDSIRRNLKLAVKIDGKLERVERWEYPLDAIREGIINAICHRDYSKTSNVQVRIFDDRLEIWSPGKLPPGITVKMLKGVHESSPPNPLIAKPFFLVGLIENWGTGTNRILEECAKAGMPEPEFKDAGTSFVITFRKDIYTEEFLTSLSLNERHIKAVMYVKVNGKIANKKYQEICDTSERTATRELKHLVSSGVLEQIGSTGKGTSYILRRNKGATKTPKAPQRRHKDAARKTRSRNESKEALE